MRINDNDLLDGVEFLPAHDNGGPLKAPPSLIVMHYTGAGRAGGSVDWLTRKDKNYVSAHVVISRTGHITQLVPFDTEAYHAGVSTWKRREWCNNYSIGIEMANWGVLDDTPEGLRAWTKKVVLTKQDAIHATHKYGRPVGWWEKFPDVQVRTAAQLVATLQNKYPSITEVVGHDDVSPGRKQDPGPAWDWEVFNGHVSRYAKGKTEPQDEEGTARFVYGSEEEIVAALHDALRQFRN